jgi:hypothetical protein
MKLAGFVFLLLASLCPQVQTATQLNIIIEEQSHPAGIGPLVASVGGSEVAVIPGAFALSLDGGPTYVVRLADGINTELNVHFSYYNGQLQLDYISRSCSPMRARGTLAQTGPRTYHLLLKESLEEPDCVYIVDFFWPSPESYVKVRFDATPSTATVFARTIPPLSDSGLPKVLNFKYNQPKTIVTVFFKSEGYLDCPRKITIAKQGALYNVNADDGSPAALTDGNGGSDVPTISCTLTKIE